MDFFYTEVLDILKMSEVYHKKLHRYPSAGRKADKKSGKSGDKKERHNPKVSLQTVRK